MVLSVSREFLEPIRLRTWPTVGLMWHASRGAAQT